MRAESLRIVHTRPCPAVEPAMTVIAGSRSSAASSLPAGVPVPHGSPAAAVPGGRSPGSGAVIRIRLLGRFAVERDGQEIALASFGGRLARRLLRLLALRRGTLVPKDLIADALWPGRPRQIPRGTSRSWSAGSAGRWATAPDPDRPGRVRPGRRRPLLGRRRGVPRRGAGRPGPARRPAGRGARLVPRRARHLARRAAPRRHLRRLGASRPAAPFTGLPGGAGWGRRSRPGERRRRPQPAEAAAWAGQAVAAEPLRESSVLLLVRALAAAGDQAGALAAFDEYRDHLAAETGLEPTPQAQPGPPAHTGRPAGGRPAGSPASAAAACQAHGPAHRPPGPVPRPARRSAR